MEKLDKTNVIIICIAAALVLILGIVMLCGSCSGKQGIDWNPLTSAGTTDDTTDGSTGDSTGNTTDGTTGATGDGTTGPTQGQTGGNGTDGPQFSVDIGDRDEVGNTTQSTSTPTTTPTTTPTETTEATTTPTETTPATEETTSPTEGNGLLTYEEWDKLSTAEKVAYRDTFPRDGLTYKEWYKAAYQKWYDENHKVTDGNIDLTD